MRVSLKIFHKWVGLVLLLLLGLGRGLATPQYYFKQISMGEGLSQTTVRCILVDHWGILWIGTDYGLNRFDRENILVYRQEAGNNSSLPSSRITFLTEGQDETLWIGTQGGLARFDRSNRSFERMQQEGKPIYADSSLPISTGIYFFGQDHFYYYDYADRNLRELPVIRSERHRLGHPFYAYMYDQGKGRVLLSFHTDGLFWYDLKSGELSPVPFFKEKRISTCYIDGKGRIWVSAYGKGLHCFDREGQLVDRLKAPESLSNGIIQDVREKNGELWIATDGGGINVYNYETRQIEIIRHIPGNPHSLPTNSFACLYNDEENNIWAGSIRGGLIGIKPVFMTTYRDAPPGADYGLSSPVVSSLYEDKEGVIWMGTDGGGLNRFDPQTEHFSVTVVGEDKKVVSIMPYNDRELLLSLFSDGFYRYNKLTNRIYPFLEKDTFLQEMHHTGNSVRLHAIDKERFCLATDGNLFFYNKKRGTLKRVSEVMPDYSFLRPTFVTGDSCYVSSEGGIYVLDLQRDSLRLIYRSPERMMTFSAVCQDKKGCFWLGTPAGLFRYDRMAQRLDTINTTHLKGVKMLCFDRQERLWIGTNEGLFAYVPDEGRLIVFGESDGVFTQEFLPTKPLFTSTGDIYMAGVEGVVRIRDNQHFEEDDDSSVGLINIMKDGIPLHLDGSLKEPEITVSQDYTTLRVSAIVKEKDLMRKKFYRFYLRGDRETMLETSRATYLFPALQPGRYELWVSYSKRNGDWSIPQKMLQVEVSPPFWEQPWFKVTCSLFLILLFFLIVRLFFYRQRQKLTGAMREHERIMYEEKVRFLINISHELRTPLTLIYAPLQRLLRSQKIKEEGLSKQLGNILLQTRRISEIIDMVLNVQKSENEGKTLSIQLQDLNAWIHLTVEEFAMELEARGFHLIYQLDPTVGQVPFDASKCRTVLSNLLMNALKFSDSGSRITLVTERMARSVRVSLVDEGIGLANTDIDQLFSRYYQGNHTRKGSGIGLAYARKLIEMHGGKIGAYDNKGRGATFYFELPLVQSPQRACTTVSAEEWKEWSYQTEGDLLPPEPDFPLGNYTVLIVEDEPALRKYLYDAFSNEFHRVYTADDGETALDRILKYQPDVIVSDVMMPRMDGFELCQRIKENISISHIPVVLLTARADHASTMQGYKVGADRYLAKPFDIDYLLIILRNLLMQREQLRRRYDQSGRLFCPKEDAISNADENFMQKLNRLIQENLNNPELNVNFIASALAMSRTSLYTKLNRLSDISLNDYITRFRMVEAAHLLTISSELSIQEIADRIGFSSARYFSTVFKQTYGKTPSEYRRSPGDFPPDHLLNER